jgi:hypothetical protein
VKHGFGEAGTEVWVLSRGEAATASPRATVSPATTALPLRLPSLPCRPTVRGRFDSGLSLLYFGPTRPRFVAWNHAANGDRGAWGTQDTETVVWRVSEWLAATLETMSHLGPSRAFSLRKTRRFRDPQPCGSPLFAGSGDNP